jgi:pimeloyl-ACP methyl ester carboxylesterase
VSGAGTFTTHDGLALSYRLAGSGPLLVCQSGGPGRASSYLRDLANLTEHRTLVLLDSRGTGSSERPDDPARLAAPYLADDLESLREHLGLETFELLGHSAGAVVAQIYAAGHPERLTKLLLVTPSGRLQGPPTDLDDIVESRRGEAGYEEALRTYDATGEITRPLLYGIWNDVTAQHAAGADTEMDHVAERHFAPAPGAVDDAAVTTNLRDVRAEVLVVAGSKDAATGVAAARAVAAAFPHARLEVLDGLGHFPWVEQPAAFLPVVRDFLAG